MLKTLLLTTALLLMTGGAYADSCPDGDLGCVVRQIKRERELQSKGLDDTSLIAGRVDIARRALYLACRKLPEYSDGLADCRKQFPGEF